MRHTAILLVRVQHRVVEGTKLHLVKGVWSISNRVKEV